MSSCSYAVPLAHALISWCTFVPPLTYQLCWWLELHLALLLASRGQHRKKYIFLGAGLSPHEVRNDYEVTQSEKYGFMGWAC
jgi:hypothetical protein